jgi:hypothetical protein
MVERYESIEDVLRAVICIRATRVFRKVIDQRDLNAKEGRKKTVVRVNRMDAWESDLSGVTYIVKFRSELFHSGQE